MHEETTPESPGSESPVPSALPSHDGKASDDRPAFYAARPGGWRDWWTLLHPPYTAWHLAYVVIGASLAPHVDLTRLLATLLAFFFAVGIAAHALDELHGRPLGTQIPTAALVALTVVGLAGAVTLGVAGLSRVGWPLIPFLVLGPLFVVVYNLELFGGLIHTDVGICLCLGLLPGTGRVRRTDRAPGPEPGDRRSGRLRPVIGPTTTEHAGSAHPSPGHPSGRAAHAGGRTVGARR